MVGDTGVRAENDKKLLLLNRLWTELDVRSWDVFLATIQDGNGSDFQGRANVTGAQIKRIKNNRGRVPLTLHEQFVAFCRKKCPHLLEVVPSEERHELDEDRHDPGWAGFLKTLGLNAKKSVEIAQRFGGRYLYALQDEGGTIAILNCHLANDLPPDWKAPRFFAWRRRSTGELRRTSGNYLFNDHFLFLIGSRVKHEDVRLSTFQVEDAPDRFKGIVSGVSYTNSMFSCRCVLWRDEKRDIAGRYDRRTAERLMPADMYAHLSDSGAPGIYMKSEAE